jgi:hypothetical protein
LVEVEVVVFSQTVLDGGDAATTEETETSARGQKAAFGATGRIAS